MAESETNGNPLSNSFDDILAALESNGMSVQCVNHNKFDGYEGNIRGVAEILIDEKWKVKKTSEGWVFVCAHCICDRCKGSGNEPPEKYQTGPSEVKGQEDMACTKCKGTGHVSSHDDEK